MIRHRISGGPVHEHKRILYMDEEERKARQEWNRFVRVCGGSMLQSWEWGLFQESLGRHIVRSIQSGMQGLFIRQPLPFGKYYLYAPYGPVCEGWSVDIFRELANVLGRPEQGKRPLWLRIEPRGMPVSFVHELSRAGFRRVASTQPSRTRVIDLRASEEELLQAMEPETRYAIRVADRRGVVIRRFSDSRERQEYFPAFWRLFEATCARHKLARYARAYYEKLIGFPETDDLTVELCFAEREGVALASALTLRFGGVAYYLYAASVSGEGRYNAPTRLLWELIRSAKAEGALRFDMWGVGDGSGPWAEVSAFKKAFGGESVAYIGTWDLPLRRNWYRFYRIARKLLR